jgi:type IV pilus assembly protein PilN
MIRVNLLPQKREAKRAAAEGSQAWLGILLGVLVLEVILLLFIYNAKRDQLASVNKKNQEIQGQIDQIKAQIANHPQIKAELKELRDREEAIQKLQSARSGPTSALLELSRVLTAGRGPTVDRDKIEQLKRDNPTAVPNPNWDPRRLWMTSYNELDRAVRIGGLARDGEDVSEFLRRLSLSDFFYEVRLLPAQKVVDPQTRLELVRFEISAKVRY